MAEQVLHHPTATGLDNRKLGMWAFLASDCMFFGSLIAGYMVSRNRSVVGPYPDDILNIYTNSTQLRISVHDLILAFGVVEPIGKDTQTRMVARVFMSPQHAKALSSLLQTYLGLYEETFGPIPGDVKESPSSGTKADDAQHDEG